MNNKSQLESVIGELKGQNSKELEAQRAAIDKQIVDMIVKQTAMNVEDIVKGLSKRKKTAKQVSPQSNMANKVGNVNANFYVDAVTVSKPKLRTGDSAANIGAKIYAVMKQDIEDRKLRSELDKNKEQELFEEEQRRQEELIATIENAKKGVKAQKPKKELPPRDEKGRFMKKEPEAKKAEAPAQKSATTETPTAKPATAKPVEAPAPKPVSASPTKPPVSTGGVSTAAKVATGVAIGAAAATAIKRIVEVGKGYNIVELQSGEIVKKEGVWNWRNNNPGNIEYGDFALSNGAIPYAHGKNKPQTPEERFAIFPTYEAGRAAKAKLIFEGKNYRDLNIDDAIARYAPAKEKANDTPAYQKAVRDAVGLPEEKLKTMRMRDFNEQQRTLILDAMQKREGYGSGKKESKLLSSPNVKIDSGENLIKSSNENKDLKSSTKGTNVAIDNTKTTVISSGGSSPQTIRTPTPSERPAIIGG